MITIEPIGLEAMQATLAALAKIAGGGRAAEFRAKARPDGADNDEIVKAFQGIKRPASWANVGDRDMFSATTKDVDDMGAEIVQAVDKRLQRIINKKIAEERKRMGVKRLAGAQRAAVAARVGKGVTMDTFTKGQATAALIDGLKRAMTLWVERARDRLDGQQLSTGGAPDPVSPEYARRRAAEYGVGTGVVGKATGSLLDNFGAAGTIAVIAE